MENKYKTGDSNQITRNYFDSLLIELRQIDSVIPKNEFELYGENFSTPIMTAALSHLDNTHPEGMTELARGAEAAEAVMWVGMGDKEELESIISTGAKTIKIIKPYADNDMIFDKIKHAEKSGALAVGMDIDHAFNNKGQYDNVAGFTMSAKTIEEIKSYISATELPFIIKGVLSEQDAYKCIDAGAEGIVVSHHHGIQDFAVPPLMLLPKIAEVVNNRVPIFVDCSVSSGMDAFKALALGANAVSVGRGLMDPLSNLGAQGVQQKIREMTEELSAAMARTCSEDVMNIEASVIHTLG